jgi:small subunit ribosomal protein S18
MAMQKNTKKRRRKIIRPKICKFCELAVRYIDFKDAETLRRYQTEQGKIHPRRITGTCQDHQKMLSSAIKRARVIGLVM